LEFQRGHQKNVRERLFHIASTATWHFAAVFSFVSGTCPRYAEPDFSRMTAATRQVAAGNQATS
ncbi:hypothetical protein, partial [Agrobacterium sp. LY4]|uniref:hypothetical protein n=2 Tax=Agrobacterium TaxID=357 RepID=UPI001AECC266